jgi:hypothetical protein
MNTMITTQRTRTQALENWGYSPREAEFLCLAALQGGYFLRRHYAQFLEQSSGGSVAALVEKLVALGHVKATSLAQNTILYHLGARPFYAALGQEDNRNRREKQPLTIKNKLIALDFVLAHRDKHFLATEHDKTEYFTGQLRIQQANLPSKLYRSHTSAPATERYFVDKYPIFVEEYPTFCFVDEGLTTFSRFETYLCQYARLFSSLKRFHVTYVAASALPFRWAQPTFTRLTAQHCGKGSHTQEHSGERLRQHFVLRQQFESKDLTAFDREKLIRFRQERQEFSGAPYDELFGRWKAQGDAALSEISAFESRSATPSVGTFSTYLVRHNYDLFGTLTAF